MLSAVLAAGGISTFGSLIGFVLALLIGWGCSRIAAGKGRSSTLWFVLGFFFTIISLIIIALLPSKDR
jgi:hypothetical protein